MMSKKLCRWELAAFLIAAAAGPLLHFAYGWSGENAVVAAFSAVNESTWEHMKLLFFPLFATSLVEMLFLADRWRNFLAVKLVDQVLVILFNYIFSKLIIFKKGQNS